MGADTKYTLLMRSILLVQVVCVAAAQYSRWSKLMDPSALLKDNISNVEENAREIFWTMSYLL